MYILDADGNKIADYSLTHGATGRTVAIEGAAVIGALTAGSPPIIVAGNREGLFKISLNDLPAFDPAGAQWPTFHRNNARTGSLDYATRPVYGSIAGIASQCDTVSLHDPDTDQLINDYYGGKSLVPPLSDGRFEFEMLSLGSYLVRFEGASRSDVLVDVTAGQLTQVNRSCD